MLILNSLPAGARIADSDGLRRLGGKLAGALAAGDRRYLPGRWVGFTTTAHLSPAPTLTDDLSVMVNF
jgi:hypothetical protein